MQRTCTFFFRDVSGGKPLGVIAHMKQRIKDGCPIVTVKDVPPMYVGRMVELASGIGPVDVERRTVSEDPLVINIIVTRSQNEPEQKQMSIPDIMEEFARAQTV